MSLRRLHGQVQGLINESTAGSSMYNSFDISGGALASFRVRSSSFCFNRLAWESHTLWTAEMHAVHAGALTHSLCSTIVCLEGCTLRSQFTCQYTVHAVSIVQIYYVKRDCADCANCKVIITMPYCTRTVVEHMEV